jgi:hypothetical protein
MAAASHIYLSPVLVPARVPGEVTWRNFYFRFFPGGIRSPQIILFLSHLLRHIPGRVLIVREWTAGTSQSRGVGFCARAARRPLARVPPSVHTGVESCGVPVGALEATRVAQLLFAELRAAQRSRSPYSVPHPPSDHTVLRLLEQAELLPS